MDANYTVAYRLVRDLWAMAHGGEPYPEMDRSIARFVVPPRTVVAGVPARMLHDV